MIPKLQVLPPKPRRCDFPARDAFHEDRVQQDLVTFSEAPGVVAKCIERARIRFEKAGQRAVVRHWTDLYTAGQQLLAAKAGMERQKTEYLQLAREHGLKESERSAHTAKFQADAEEDNLRRDKAAYQREHLERFVQGSNLQLSEDEQKLNEADQRRQLDLRWELNESLRSLHTLVELQHWRRQQRDLILRDRSLSPEEQDEDLHFIDDLFQAKYSQLKADTRIFQER